jgi:hypothetical protein
MLARQGVKLDRSEAIRRLVELDLTVKRTKSAPSERQRAALADLASRAIDSLTVSKPNNGEKASRKRRLTKWHEEIREARVEEVVCSFSAIRRLNASNGARFKRLRGPRLMERLRRRVSRFDCSIFQ